MRVDGEVELRQPREVAHRFELATLPAARRLLAAQVLRDVGGDLVRRVALRRPLAERAAAGARVFEDDLFGMFLHCHVRSLAQAARTAALRVSVSASAYASMSASRARFGGAHQQRIAELGIVVATGRSRRRCRGARARRARRHRAVELQHGLVEARAVERELHALDRASARRRARWCCACDSFGDAREAFRPRASDM